MIFYFTGTGNSLYAARRLAEQDGSELVDMSQYRSRSYSCTLRDGESIGFVFPVYFYTVNDAVLDFIRNLEVKGGSGYAYAVITCGASIGGAGAFLKEKLAQRQIDLQAVFPIVMPDNCLIYYNTATPETSAEVLKKASVTLSTISARIKSKEKTSFGSPLLAKIGLTMYHAMANASRYSVTDSCIGCGKCEQNCPDNNISLKDGKPVWNRKKCLMCLSCINRCPVSAIQYGRQTASRTRFENVEAFRR